MVSGKLFPVNALATRSASGAVNCRIASRCCKRGFSGSTSGLGLSADVVSTNGATRAERWISTEVLWKWIDAHGEEFGVGRPYHDRDPPHLAPLDGEEYAKHNPGKVRIAKSGR